MATLLVSIGSHWGRGCTRIVWLRWRSCLREVSSDGYWRPTNLAHLRVMVDASCDGVERSRVFVKQQTGVWMEPKKSKSQSACRASNRHHYRNIIQELNEEYPPLGYSCRFS